MSTVAPLRSLLDARIWRDPECHQGMRDMARVAPGMMAWGLVTGVAMTTSGLPLGVVLCMSLGVFAASAQLSAVPLMMVGAPLWVVWMTALCVNLRFVIFSAQLRPHMQCLPLRWRLVAGYLSADVTYVLTVHRHGQGEPAGPQHPAPLAYFAGAALVNWASWNLASLAGIAFAAQVPTAWGLAFAGTLALLALLITLLKDRISAVATTLAGVAAIACHGVPFRLHILVAVLVAVGAGLWLERQTSARSAR
ncbi:AzlC family ABC transporter permease [Aquabacterium commune]|nr:AzlC family ABC transporter permease [Aquabacterium commune]